MLILLMFSFLSETVFAYSVPVSNENENDRRTLRCACFAWIFFSILSETVFAHIFPVSKENENPWAAHPNER